jgi:hypothetical protein
VDPGAAHVPIAACILRGFNPKKFLVAGDGDEGGAGLIALGDHELFNLAALEPVERVRQLPGGVSGR